MAKLADLLANRRIPGETHHRRMDPSLQEELAATDPSIEEVQYRGGAGRGSSHGERENERMELFLKKSN